MVSFTRLPPIPPGIQWIRGWMGPRTGLDIMEKVFDLTGIRTPADLSVVQPIASRYNY
jgi:hypothetical protein